MTALRNRHQATPAKLKFRRFAGAPRRLSRRRGFGIHSPFAFDFVKRVISQPCSYYCYPVLSATARKNGISSRYLKLLFRLALFFRPASVAVYSDCDSAVTTALKAAVPEISPAPEPEFMVVDRGGHEAEALACLLRGGTVVIGPTAGNAATIQHLWSGISRGMLFRGSRTAIFVGRRHLPKQAFNIWL